jgi:CheY-like chemotaxis protein
LAAARTGAHVVLTVRDTGIGLAPEELSRIFEMFTQVDVALEKAQGGLGIGLNLVKSLVELHDGTVEAHSDGSGRGSEFVVRLPIAVAPTEAAGDESTSDESSAGPCRILVVDDNHDAALSLAKLLRLSGHEVHTVHDGLEAVAAAETLEPQVVLLDIGLPKLNGYEAARRIRAQQGRKNVLLVALTGWGQEEDRRRSRESGFDAHLVKPVDFKALKALLVTRARVPEQGSVVGGMFHDDGEAVVAAVE